MDAIGASCGTDGSTDSAEAAVNSIFNELGSSASAEEDVNLINTDYFNTKDSSDEKLLLTFINKNPEVLGLNLIDVDAIARSEFDPALTYSQTISSESFNIGFTTEYVQVDANESNTGDAIVVEIKNIYNPVTKKAKNNDNITIRYRTRAGHPDVAIVLRH